VLGVGPESYTVVVEDKTAPKPPVDLSLNASETGGFLTWESNAEGDLAGYRVFRSEKADSGFGVISSRVIPTNLFFDVAYKPGLYYGVSAVDEFGNESKMSAPFRAP